MASRILTLALIVGMLAIAGDPQPPRGIREVNAAAIPSPDAATAIIGATLIDGRGGPPVTDAVVLVRGARIIAAGPRASTPLPRGAAVIAANGLFLLPGLIDAHFHLDGDDKLPSLALSRGVTSVRDPGAWIEAYAGVRQSGRPLPRLFLAGPHLDTAPPAYPADSFIVRDAEETRLAVNCFIDQGASVIKVYFRLPLGLARIAAETAHARGVPVTAHLEIVDAADAIRAGVDGIEHITSFGTALLPPREAEKYRQSILADNNARREGRYKVWSEIDLDAPRVRPLLDLIARRSVFVSPTLAVFEKRAGDPGAAELHVRAFERMLRFTGMVRRAGGRVVAGSHSSVPHAEPGWAYQRELELLVASGLTPMQALMAATIENARFFRIIDRLGTIEPGKLADLILIDGDPLKEISAMRRVSRVMLNGQWIEKNPGRENTR
ncbi:MAG: amidohydrolase family protein [Blastocatellia bacterium]